MALYALRFLNIDSSKKALFQAELPGDLGLAVLTHDREEADFILSPVVDIEPKEADIRVYLDSKFGKGGYILLNIKGLLDRKG